MSIALALTFSCPHLVCTTDLDSFAKLSFSRREKNYFQWGQPTLKKGKANLMQLGAIMPAGVFWLVSELKPHLRPTHLH